MKRPTRYKSKTAEQAAKGYNAFLKRHGQPAATKWTKRSTPKPQRDDGLIGEIET